MNSLFRPIKPLLKSNTEKEEIAHVMKRFSNYDHATLCTDDVIFRFKKEKWAKTFGFIAKDTHSHLILVVSYNK